MNIRVFTGKAGWVQLIASWRRNWVHYLQEAAGLFLFMISACLFGALLESERSSWHIAIPDGFLRTVLMGILMGATALFIFYSRFTSPSGSHINPAVTITFWRLGKSCHWDTLFFILFQITGGTLAVYCMQIVLGQMLTDAPVNSVATVPGKYGVIAAAITECIIAFITMSIVLIMSAYEQLKKYTRIVASILVCCWVILAGPVSGFGMNPARSFASALASGTWTAWWIYLFAPLAGMLLAAENFLLVQRIHSTRKIKIV